MKRYWWILALVALSGCGGAGQKFPSGSLSVIVHFPAKRVIPAEAQRVRVQITGEGLTQSLEKVAERPSSQESQVRIIFEKIPTGPKTINAFAEDQYGTHRAIGTGETNILPNQTVTVNVELSLTNFASVIGRCINIRTGQPASGVTVKIDGQQAVSGNDGTFAVTNVPEGEHNLEIFSSEYRGYSKSITVTTPLTDLGEIILLPQQLMEPPSEPEF